MGHKGCDQQQELTIDFDIGYSIKVRRFGCLRGGGFLCNLLEGRDSGSYPHLLPRAAHKTIVPRAVELLSCSPCIPALDL